MRAPPRRQSESRTRNPEARHTRRRKANESLDAAEAGKVWVEGDFAASLARGRWDLDFFCEALLGIKPHVGQSEFFRAVLLRDMTGWRPRYLDIDVSAGNRAGKTLGEAIAEFHSTFYKIGQPPPSLVSVRSLKKWMQSDYSWYHFAIAQETSELAFIEITRILQGTHEAQKNGCPLTETLGPGVARWDKKYRSEYLWLKMHEVFGGGEIHYRTTGEKAVGSLGKDMHGIAYDEGAFDPNFQFVVDEVLHMRRLSTGGQLWIVGTSTEGLTAFSDHWQLGDPDQPDRNPDKFSLRMSTRDNIGYGITQEMFDRLVASMPDALVPQNIDGYFLESRKSFFSQSSVDQSFIDDLPEVEAPKKGHRYVQGADPALSMDSTWSIVLDVTRSPNTGVAVARHRGRTSGPVVASLVTNAHNAYNSLHEGYSCLSGIDSTGFGGAMFRDLLPIQVRSIEFGGTRGKKLKLLNDLRSALDTGKLRFPRSGPWLALRRQLLGYRLEDKNMETDGVMALAVAVSMLRLAPEGSQPSVPFDYFGPETRGVPSRPSGPPLASFGRRAVVYSSLSDMERRSRGN